MEKKTTETKEPPRCYICLDNDLKEGKLPVRDCACRGDDAGYAHMSCLVEYAINKNEQDEQQNMIKHGCFVDAYELMKPWVCCQQCIKEHCNEVSIELVTHFLL